jgi:hypothetical protein
VLISQGLLEQVREHFEIAACVRDVCIAVSVTTFASVWLARRRPAWLRAWPIAWLALALAAIAFCCALSMGYHDATIAFPDYDDDMRMLVIFGGAIALFISLASFALRSVNRRK